MGDISQDMYLLDEVEKMYLQILGTDEDDSLPASSVPFRIDMPCLEHQRACS